MDSLVLGCIGSPWLREMVDDDFRNEKVVLVVFLDIVNTFNSFPWSVILEGKVSRNTSGASWTTISQRGVVYEDLNNRFVRIHMTYRVLQGLDNTLLVVRGPIF